MFRSNNQQQYDNIQVGGSAPSSGSTNKIIAPPDPSPDATLDSAAAEQTAAPDSPNVLPGNLTSPEPTSDESAAPAPPSTAPIADDMPVSASPPVGSDDLLALKQDALQHLSPLVSHLDQPPEERFRTIMMMIQATDDHTKIKEAYAAANNISDDKIRAQALLDVINEINYFTQAPQKKE